MAAPVDEMTFQKARRRWARPDPTLAACARAVPQLTRAITPGSSFEALVSSIVHQQVSLAAGRTIFGRVESACGGHVTPSSIAAQSTDALRAAGLSRAKTAYVSDLAQRAISGALDLEALETLPDDEVIAELTQVKGIGTWTAKMHLIFHLDRPDVLPHEDLGLQLAVSKAYGVPRERAAIKMQELHPTWSPYASYASLVLWNWRRTVDGLPKLV